MNNISILLAGKNEYSTITDKQKSEQGYDAVLDLTKIWNPAWGGILYYRFKDQKKAVPCGYNSLTLVHKKNTKQYLKYLNHHAKGKRILVLFSNNKL